MRALLCAARAVVILSVLSGCEAPPLGASDAGVPADDASTPRADAGRDAAPRDGGAPAAGDRCEEAIVIDARVLPGSSERVVPEELRADRVSYEGLLECPGIVVRSPVDAYFRFTPETDGVYTFAIESEDRYASGDLYLVSSCDGSFCDALQAWPTFGARRVALEAGETVWIAAIASLEEGRHAPFRVTVSAPCTPECTGRVCGDDGCGLPCGTCEGSDVCASEQGLCLDTDIAGQTCDAPRVIDPSALPFRDEVEARLYRRDSAIECEGIGTEERVELYYEITPAVSGVYTFDVWGALGVLSTSACVTSCEGAVAHGEGRFRAELEAGTTYTLASVAWPRSDELLVYVRVSEACVPSCEGRECGGDGCGGSCGGCDGAAGMECAEDVGQCRAVESYCTEGGASVYGPCDVPGFVCDPRACRGGCDDCVWASCSATSSGTTEWTWHHYYAPSSCGLRDCPTLPIEVPFDWSHDYSSASAGVPLDPSTGACLTEGDAALSFGQNGYHASYVVGANGWRIVAASAGTLFEGGIVLDVAVGGPVTVRVVSPSDRSFDVRFVWGSSVRVEAIEPVP